MTPTINYHPNQGRVTLHNAYLTLLASPPLNHWVESFWQLNVPDGKYFYRSVPDNSVDLILNLNNLDDIFIITPFCTAKVFELSGPVVYFGIRFHILGERGLISTALGEWHQDDPASVISDILPANFRHQLTDLIVKSHSFNTLCEILSALMLTHIQQPKIDPRLFRFIRHCHKNIASYFSFSDKQCAEFGLSARQLRRLSQLHLGLSPRQYARVLRFQFAIKSMTNADDKNAWAALYYDQPHFIREFKNLSGLTPTEFNTLSVLYNHPPQ